MLIPHGRVPARLLLLLLLLRGCCLVRPWSAEAPVDAQQNQDAARPPGRTLTARPFPSPVRDARVITAEDADGRSYVRRAMRKLAEQGKELIWIWPGRGCGR